MSTPTQLIKNATKLVADTISKNQAKLDKDIKAITLAVIAEINNTFAGKKLKSLVLPAYDRRTSDLLSDQPISFQFIVYGTTNFWDTDENLRIVSIDPQTNTFTAQRGKGYKVYEIMLTVNLENGDKTQIALKIST